MEPHAHARAETLPKVPGLGGGLVPVCWSAAPETAPHTGVERPWMGVRGRSRPGWPSKADPRGRCGLGDAERPHRDETTAQTRDRRSSRRSQTRSETETVPAAHDALMRHPYTFPAP